MEGAFILPQGFGRGSSINKGMFRVVEPPMQELQELKVFSQEKELLHYGF